MADGRDRDDHGRFQSEVSDEEIITIVEELQPAGTKEIADELGLTRQSADYRLRKLKQRRLVTMQKIGGTLIWSREN